MARGCQRLGDADKEIWGKIMIARKVDGYLPKERHVHTQVADFSISLCDQRSSYK